MVEISQLPNTSIIERRVKYRNQLIFMFVAKAAMVLLLRISYYFTFCLHLFYYSINATPYFCFTITKLDGANAIR